jgi:hypothetical protein
MADADGVRLLVDGIRLVLMVIVEMDERNQSPLPRAIKDDIQAWYDRCYELMEGEPPP